MKNMIVFGLLFAASPLLSAAPVTYATNVFSILDHTILPGNVVHLEGVNISSSHVDTSQAATTGAIVFKSAGIYRIDYKIQCHLTPPFPIPVPAFSFGLTLNNVAVPGSHAGDFIGSPSEVVREVYGSVAINVAKNQVLRLVNTSTNPVDLVANIFGSNSPLASATIVIIEVH